MSAWSDIEARAPLHLTREQYAALEVAYSTPPRAYHSSAHVLAVIDHWSDVDRRLGWQQRLETFLALLYHDAVYVAGRHDNEYHSAIFARGELSAMNPVDVARVEALIRLTAAHGKLTSEMVDRDAALGLDCDMAILGAPPDVYAAYEESIAFEYGHVPRMLYRTGRSAFLDRLLAQPRIFLSEDFHSRFDRQTRMNLALARDALT